MLKKREISNVKFYSHTRKWNEMSDRTKFTYMIMLKNRIDKVKGVKFEYIPEWGAVIIDMDNNFQLMRVRRIIKKFDKEFLA